jgi:glucosamine--fructose-6-phosphate aminotransferase (isomerizing)
VCGIVGYIGTRQAAPVIIDGLAKLEYRGYDSFGIATLNGKIRTVKRQGRITEGCLKASEMTGRIGIGHTRWATHGVPNELNAHPHLDCKETIAIVHNGIVENYAELKRELVARGHRFRSDTDTEVVVHLIEEKYQEGLFSAVKYAVSRLSGSYALLVIAEDEDRIIAARQQSPLVIGIGDGEFIAASDITPILAYTERAIFLEDEDIACISPHRLEIYHAGDTVERKVELIDWSVEDVKKGGFRHFMLKEIFEEPLVFSNTIRALRQQPLPEVLEHPEQITVVACGTSYHAGLLFKYLLEESCQIPVRIEQASEFKYFPPPPGGVVIGITQSGETADTIAALKEAKAHGSITCAITNVLGSTVTRLADHTLYMHAGPEISVAATKSYISQLAVLMQLGSSICGGTSDEILNSGKRAIEEVLLLDLDKAVKACVHARDMFYVGRGPFYPVVLEGALKMKEISYIHAEGYAAGEIKHGPFALLSPETPVVAICTPGRTFAVMLSNIEEMIARGTPIIALGRQGDPELEKVVDVFLPLPPAEPIIDILTSAVALQLLAYHTADALGRDIDRPRNLAKSVTVE